MSLQTRIDKINEIAKDATIQMLLLTDPEIISWKSYFRVRYGCDDERAGLLARLRVAEKNIRTMSEVNLNRLGITYLIKRPKIIAT